MRNVSAPSPTSADVTAGQRCATCKHLWTEHDDIAARFCAATIVGGHSRGCVCTPAESAEAN